MVLTSVVANMSIMGDFRININTRYLAKILIEIKLHIHLNPYFAPKIKALKLLPSFQKTSKTVG